jgi:hypothetical protein
MTQFLSRKLPVLLIVILAPIVVYFNSLRNPFHFDDMHTIVNNPYIRELGNIPRFFVYPQMFSAKSHPRGMYRPVLLISFALNYRLTDMKAYAFRMVNLALHIANALVVFFIFHLLVRVEEGSSTRGGPEAEKARHRRVTSGFAAVAALVFALHPVQSEALNYISSRSEILASSFYLLALLAFIAFLVDKSAPRARSYWLLSASVLLYVLSLLTKTIAISFPVMILFLSVVFWLRQKKHQRLSTLLLYQVPFWIVTCAYLLLRTMLFNYTFTATKQRGVFVNLLTQTSVMVHYLQLIIVPVGLSVEHEFQIIQSPFDYRFVMSFIILGTICAVIVWLVIRRQRVIAFCLGWFFIALLPTSSVLPLEVVMSEHRLYLPVAGLALAVSLALRRLMLWRRFSPNAGKTIVAAIIAVLALWGGMVIARNKVWSTEIGLWSDALRKSPGSIRAYGKLANAYRNEQDYKKALEICEAGMKLDKRDPQMPWLIYNFGTFYHELKDYEHAAEYYREALRVGGPSPIGYSALATAYLDMGKFEEAIEAYRQALAMTPEPSSVSSVLHYQLALAYLGAGRKNEAVAELQKSLSLNPNQPEVIKFLRGAENSERGAQR